MNPYLAVGIMAGFVLLALSTSLSNIITTRGLALSVAASLVPLAAGWGIMWTLGAAVVGYVVGSLWARHGVRKADAITARCT